MAIRYLSGINVDSNTLFVDDANNRVGIGTASPNSALEISQLTPIVRINSSDNTQFHGIEFRNGGSLDAFIKQLPETGEFRISNGRGASWGGHITLYTDTVERLRITAAGNVGIGTTSPTHKLHVLNAAAVAVIGDGNDNYFGNYSSGDYWDIGNLGATGNVYLESRGASVNINNQYRAKGAGSHIWTYNGGSNEVMRTTSAGNVGIGTTAPAAKLHVVDSSNETVAKFSGPNDTTIIIGGSDLGSGEKYITYQNNTTGTDAWMVGMDDDETFRFAYGAAGEITDANAKMIILQTGNVGIGTTSPATKLDVNGGINIANGNNLTWGGAYAAGIPTIVGYNAGTGGALYFYPNGSTSGEKMRLHASLQYTFGYIQKLYCFDILCVL